MEANTAWKLTLFPLRTRNTALMEQKLEHEITRERDLRIYSRLDRKSRTCLEPCMRFRTLYEIF